MNDDDPQHGARPHLPYLWVLCAATSGVSAYVAIRLLLRPDRDFSAFGGPLFLAVAFGALSFAFSR